MNDIKEMLRNKDRSKGLMWRCLLLGSAGKEYVKKMNIEIAKDIVREHKLAMGNI